MEWLRQTRNRHWDLGSNPRSPKIIVCSFSSCVHVQASKGVPPCASNIQTPCGFRHESKGQDGVITILPVNHAHGESQSQTGLRNKWASDSRTNLPNGPTPPGFFFFLSLYFLFLSLIILLLLSLLVLFN